METKLNALVDSHGSDRLYEMANITQDITGLPVVIYMSPKNAAHGPRIKVQKDYSSRFSLEFFTVTIEDTPRVDPEKTGTGKLKSADINTVVDFVKLNKGILLDYWFGRETSLKKVFAKFEENAKNANRDVAK